MHARQLRPSVPGWLGWCCGPGASSAQRSPPYPSSSLDIALVGIAAEARMEPGEELSSQHWVIPPSGLRANSVTSANKTAVAANAALKPTEVASAATASPPTPRPAS